MVTVSAPPGFTTAPFSGVTICNCDAACRVAVASHSTEIAEAIDPPFEPLSNEGNRLYSCSKAARGRTPASWKMSMQAPAWQTDMRSELRLEPQLDLPRRQLVLHDSEGWILS